MAKRFYILCICIISSCGFINAQEWSKEDSIWLINILEGKINLDINEDTKKAIEDGRLVTPLWMNSEDNKYGIGMIKDFEQGIDDSTRIHSVDPYSMPPAVYAMYVLYMEKMDSIYESRTFMLSAEERNKLEEAMPPSARNRFYYNEQVGGVGNLDFNHILCMVFSPSYRQKMHNKKHATSYKNYYDEGAIKPIIMNERERRELRQSLINVSIKNSNMPGAKSNPIDD
ncbi:MAG: hypothetical protein LBV74_01295 [Tannerella sp.]|jgi:hypothetical protein|nr:hypothetical protein [Tannerella sp.]